jgi:hypothetical protein
MQTTKKIKSQDKEKFEKLCEKIFDIKFGYLQIVFQNGKIYDISELKKRKWNCI